MSRSISDDRFDTQIISSTICYKLKEHTGAAASVIDAGTFTVNDCFKKLL